jgi:hypothetical protein
MMEVASISSFLFNPVIWKQQTVLVVGAACYREYLISRLQGVPTIFLWKLGLSEEATYFIFSYPLLWAS